MADANGHRQAELVSCTVITLSFCRSPRQKNDNDGNPPDFLPLTAGDWRAVGRATLGAVPCRAAVASTAPRRLPFLRSLASQLMTPPTRRHPFVGSSDWLGLFIGVPYGGT